MIASAPGAMTGRTPAASAVAVNSTISSARMAAYSGQVVTCVMNIWNASGWLHAYFGQEGVQKAPRLGHQG